MANRREFLKRLSAVPLVAGAYARTPGGVGAAPMPAQATSDDWRAGLAPEQDLFLAAPPDCEW